MSEIDSNQSGDPDFQSKLESLVSLVSSRCQGLSADEEIENAVSSLLSPIDGQQTIQPTNNTMNSNKRSVVTCDSEIVQDEGNYDDSDDNDDDDDDNEGPPTKKVKASSSSDKTLTEPKWTGEKATMESLMEQEEKIKMDDLKYRQENNLQFDISETWKDLEDIPLGITGAKIMITFGDGPQPNPQACAAALLATRQCIQNAVKDARALRRKMKKEYDKARVAVNLHRAKRKQRALLADSDGNLDGAATGVDLDLYFKAIKGNDKLSYDNPCGFDTVQLEKLFPEEMYAYQRWNKMHQAYTDSKNDRDDGRNKATTTEGQEEEREDMKEAVNVMQNNVGGHLKERLAQFDLRTERMKESWYMAFSEVRKGSFLTRGGLSAEDRAWEKQRKTGTGRKKTSTWEALPSSHIRFLHWVGFDQRSSLPPPEPSTAEALAFLGYDFMGKIIEKSIFLKCLERREKQRVEGAKEDEILMEMGPNDQLTKEDIHKALMDSTVVTKPLYNASESSLQASAAAQIYFGPGFEDRIEMEMEQ